jgi:Capsule assembly protein Wzi
MTVLGWAAAGCTAQNLSTNPQMLSPGAELDASMAQSDTQGSVYVPLDNWVYPALDRLHALGYIDSAFLGMRPWTRASIAHMLELCADRIQSDTNNDEARSIYVALVREFRPEIARSQSGAPLRAELESVYTVTRGTSGTPLHDSFHLGQTIVNDYGRPYEGGFDNYSGFSAHAEAGRFSFYFRGETQYAPSAAGYSTTLAALLSNIDGIPYGSNSSFATIPAGPIASTGRSRVLEATLSFHLLGHELSFGKDDHWLGPDKGASMLWGNNAENVYEFQINKIEPFRVPGLSRITGPFRYDFFVGALHGHTLVPNPAYQASPSPNVANVINPGDPWVHMEKISFKPTRDLEFGFDRLAIWGGEGHEPITIHTFLRSFFSFQNVVGNAKLGRDDPGYRLGTFDFTWRLPFFSHWVTLYTDSLVHDDVSPVSAPRRSGYHPGIYLARFPGLQHLDLRLEGGNTEPTSHADPSGTLTNQGQFYYWETIQRQGPTNNGNLFGDWVGRQGKGGQVWLTYHITPQEEVQFQYRNAKASSAFIPGGTTQNDFAVQVVKRIRKDIELRGWIQFESWKAPIYKPGLQSDTTASFQITWFAPQKSK